MPGGTTGAVNPRMVPQDFARPVSPKHSTTVSIRSRHRHLHAGPIHRRDRVNKHQEKSQTAVGVSTGGYCDLTRPLRS